MTMQSISVSRHIYLFLELKSILLPGISGSVIIISSRKFD